MMEGELGAFLRARREATAPASVGLAHGSRRRTPGLRRSELATLAGVSVEYLTRIEQGKDTRPSGQVLSSIAAALRLDDADRTHLQDLSAVSSGSELLCRRARTEGVREVRPTVEALLHQLDPAPAVVVNHLTDLLMWNDAYEALARPIGLLDADRPNLLAFLFTDRRSRGAYPEWDVVVDDLVATLHEQRHDDPAADELAARLASEAGVPFSSRWNRRPTGGKRYGSVPLTHPLVGPLRLDFETLDLSGTDRQRIVLYLAADAASASALDRLAGRYPGALRSVEAS